MVSGCTARVALILVALVFPIDSFAIFRAYLSSAGNDANPCTLPQPCRLLPAALGAVDTGGEIWMVDSANYNTATVTIDKSVSILAVPGVVGSLVGIAPSDDAVIINSGRVKLHNLVIRHLGVRGGRGIAIPPSALPIEVFMESVTIEDFGQGVWVQGSGNIFMKDSLLRSNNTGLSVVPFGNVAQTISVERSTIAGGTSPIEAVATTSPFGSVQISFKESTIDASTSLASTAVSVAGGGLDGQVVTASFVRTAFIGRGTAITQAIVSSGSRTTVSLSECHFVGYPGSYALTSVGAGGLGLLRSYGNNTSTGGSMSGHTTVAPQ